MYVLRIIYQMQAYYLLSRQMIHERAILYIAIVHADKVM